MSYTAIGYRLNNMADVDVPLVHLHRWINTQKYNIKFRMTKALRKSNCYCPYYAFAVKSVSHNLLNALLLFSVCHPSIRLERTVWFEIHEQYRKLDLYKERLNGTVLKISNQLVIISFSRVSTIVRSVDLPLLPTIR